MSRRGPARRVWLVPGGLAAISAFGLVSALLGDGVWDVLSWLALFVPLAACVWHGVLRRRIRTSSPSATPSRR